MDVMNGLLDANIGVVNDVLQALAKAEDKFPVQGMDTTIIALGEEYGETCQAYLNTKLGLPKQGDDLYTEAKHWVRTYMSGKKNMDAELEPEEVAAVAIPYFTEALANVDDEDRLVMRDWQGQEWPW